MLKRIREKKKLLPKMEEGNNKNASRVSKLSSKDDMSDYDIK
jgi:hypothetical protein